MTSIDPDLEIIANSLRMLPTWDWDDGDGSWWARYLQLCGEAARDHRAESYSETISAKNSPGSPPLSQNAAALAPDMWEAHECAKYVLMFFDINHPAMYEHLDAVTPTFNAVIPGTIGRRSAETICAAAWRVIVATEPNNHYSHNFSVPDPW